MTQTAKIPRAWLLAAGLVLILLTCLAYGGARHFEFVEIDDDQYVTENPWVKAGISLQGLAWAFTGSHAANWHPLTWLSHMLDCQVFGLWAGGHHLVNLVFHVLNTILWFWFFFHLTRAAWPSFLVAALFALHPLHVESVAWVSERKDVLSTFFWLATMFAYVRYTQKPGVGAYLLVMLLLGLGLMSKPMLVTLPLVLLLLDYWPLSRWPADGAGAPGKGKGRKVKAVKSTTSRCSLILEKLPLLALSGLSSLITLAAQKSGGALMSLERLSLAPRLANALWAYLWYLGKLFWPVNLAFFYPFQPAPVWQTVAAALVLLVLSYLFLVSGRRRPYLAVGWLWYLVTLVPVIGLVQVGGQAAADRYTYVPYIGLFIILAWGLFDLTAAWRRQKAALAAATVLILAVCLILTRQQALLWQNSVTLFQHALKVTDQNYMAYNHLGMAFSNQGKLPEAINMFRKCLEISPTYSFAYNNLAIAYAKQGKLPLAVDTFQQAIKINPGSAVFYRNLAVAYGQQGKAREAAAMLEKARSKERQAPLPPSTKR